MNKAITLELAKQIASIGGTPTDALQSGTFAPGQIGDPTAKGNSCDDANDAEGCIFTQNLLVEDATEDEINEVTATFLKLFYGMKSNHMVLGCCRSIIRNLDLCRRHDCDGYRFRYDCSHLTCVLIRWRLLSISFINCSFMIVFLGCMVDSSGESHTLALKH